MTRDVLPNRRKGEQLDFVHETPNRGRVSLHVGLGYYDDGRLGEVFVSGTKIGSDLDIAYREAAILLSFALQHGCDPRTIRTAMIRDANGRAEGVIGSLLDAILSPGALSMFSPGAGGGRLPHVPPSPNELASGNPDSAPGASGGGPHIPGPSPPQGESNPAIP